MHFNLNKLLAVNRIARNNFYNHSFLVCNFISNLTAGKFNFKAVSFFD